MLSCTFNPDGQPVSGEMCVEPGDCAICPSERLVPTACTSSAPGEVTGCERLYDSKEFADPPQNQSVSGLNCNDGGGSSFCVYDGDCGNGCIRDVWIQFDLGAPRSVHRIRYMADWWAKRPDHWELWVSDDAAATPDNGATMVTSGIGEANPWRCVVGESCVDDSIPDACCPDGRDQLQDTTDVGEFWPRFDELAFPGQTGRYWYYVIRDTRDKEQCLLFELELIGDECPR